VEGKSEGEGREWREGVSVVDVMEGAFDDEKVNEPEGDVQEMNEDDD
jgi:hypothetical protein